MSEEYLASDADTRRFLKRTYRSSRWWGHFKALVLLSVPVMAAYGALFTSGRADIAWLAFTVVPLAIGIAEVLGSRAMRRKIESLDIEPLRVLPVAYHRPDLFAFRLFMKEPLREHFPKLLEKLTLNSPATEEIKRGDTLIANGFDGTLEEALPLIKSWDSAKAWVAGNVVKEEPQDEEVAKFRSVLRLTRILAESLPEGLRASTEAALSEAERRHAGLLRRLNAARAAGEDAIVDKLSEQMDALKREVEDANLLLAESDPSEPKLKSNNEALACFNSAMTELA